MKTQETKEELILQKENLEGEIERLQKIIDASSETTFEIIIEDLKEQMIDNVNREMWANVKSCIKEVDSVNGTRNFIEKQSSLLAKKKDELKDITERIDNYQPSLFESEQQDEIECTDFVLNDKNLYTGDVFENANEDEYYLVKKSIEITGSFAIISNGFEGERCLQYPSNFKILNDTKYIGNIYDEDDKGYEEARQALAVIAESISQEGEN